MSPSTPEKPRAGWRARLHEVIFEADTAAGKAFDIGLIASILLSVTTVMLESVPSIRTAYGDVLTRIEWFFTILFSIEYLLRLVSVKKPLRYITSFFGFVDILALLPTYLSLLLPGTQYLFTIRILRLLRVFRILKLSEYLSEASTLMGALQASRRKISVFILTVLLLVVIIGSMMYIVEGEEHGFTSIPTSIYWAIVTLTTVGYGDLSPQTPLGKALASLVMIMGYGIIAVPTGIVTAEISQAAMKFKQVTSQACPNCSQYGHDADATFCKYCGSRL
ncbi:ion transporter [Fibrivirga algicola]|uniref:Ion transporter n=1 Tax=Fibrivirga algicola TaxID=2950420 RepID=A0ABX0QC74_9BACT|nr:ion transporter [Fibrivirga algicola]ARK10771.1 ion transporter [Fibrella sp. ES10-3-2-2]NID09999.1 ion transporter [Fibrivirga algicola]